MSNTLFSNGAHITPPDSYKYHKNHNDNIHKSKLQIITLTNEKDKYRVTQYDKKKHRNLSKKFNCNKSLSSLNTEI